jgi:short-subunit dehydrogenase
MAEQTATGNDVVVITGASSGFGKGVARRLAKEGVRLVLAARRTPLLEELAHECELAGARALPVEVDVSRRKDMERLARQTMAEFGGFDVWINNAGAGAIGRFEEIPLEDHVQVVETTLLGTLFGSYFAMQHFRDRGHGTLVNVASVIGRIPSPYYVSYCAAKSGVVGLGAALRQELRENGVEGIHVCTVMPASNDTPFFDHAANYSGHLAAPIPPLYDPEETIETIVRMISAPEDEVVVGAQVKMMVAAHGMAQSMVEKMMAKTTHQAQIENAPPAAESHGGLHEPIYEGTEVYGGRMAAK